MDSSIQPQMKQCHKCKETKPISEFFRDRNTSDGYCPRCKICKQRRWHRIDVPVTPEEANSEVPAGMKRCSLCKQVKPFDDFFRDRRTKTGRAHHCKTCVRLCFDIKDKEVLPEGMKRCTQCKEVKPINDFTKRRKNGTTKLPKCRTCLNGVAANYRAQHPERGAEVWWRYVENGGRWRNYLRSQYGITPEQYDDMYAAQFGLCAVCGLAPNNGYLAVDHCHTSGVIRGLLCNPCNSMLGFAKDNPTTLKKAIKYLNKHLS